VRHVSGLAGGACTCLSHGTSHPVVCSNGALYFVDMDADGGQSKHPEDAAG